MAHCIAALTGTTIASSSLVTADGINASDGSTTNGSTIVGSTTDGSTIVGSTTDGNTIVGSTTSGSTTDGSTSESTEPPGCLKSS